MAPITTVLLRLFVACSAALECAWGMQVGGTQIEGAMEARATRTVASAIRARAMLSGEEVPNIEEHMMIVNKTLDSIADIVGEADNATAELLVMITDVITTAMQALDKLEMALQVAAWLPGGDAIQAQGEDVIDTVNETLARVAMRLTLGRAKAVDYLKTAPLQQSADVAYHAFMAVQHALDALEASSKDAAAWEDAGLASRRLRAALDLALERKGWACNACCYARKAIASAEEKSDLFFQGIKNLNETVTKAIGQFTKVVENGLKTINVTVSQALEDAAGTKIPDDALAPVGNAFDTLLRVPVATTAREGLESLSSIIDGVAKKLTDGLTDTLHEPTEYYNQKCKLQTQ